MACKSMPSTLCTREGRHLLFQCHLLRTVLHLHLLSCSQYICCMRVQCYAKNVPVKFTIKQQVRQCTAQAKPYLWQGASPSLLYPISLYHALTHDGRRICCPGSSAGFSASQGAHDSAALHPQWRSPGHVRTLLSSVSNLVYIWTLLSG